MAELDINKIYLNGIPFVGVGKDKVFGWEEKPQRSDDNVLFTADNEVFLMARVVFDFINFNEITFQQMWKLIQNRNITAKFYDWVTLTWVTRDMYCPQCELDKFYAIDDTILGLVSYKVVFLGTKEGLTDIGSVMQISYNANGGDGNIGSQYVSWSSQVSLDNGNGFVKYGCSLGGWNTKADGSGWVYLPNQSITVFDNLTLFAQWVVA